MCKRIAVMILFASHLALARSAADEATEHYAEGTKLYNLARYDEAITEYIASYQLKDDPRCLFNIAQAHRLADHPDKALTFYRNYLRLVPDSPVKAAVEERIAEMERVRSEKKAKPDGPIATDGRIDQGTPIDAPDEPAPAPAPPRPVRHRFRGGGIALIVTGAALALSFGVGFGLAASIESAAVEAQARMGSHFDPSLESAGKTFQGLSIATYVIGGAMVATGVALIVIGSRDSAERPKTARLTPVVGPGFAGLSLAGGF